MQSNTSELLCNGISNSVEFLKEANLTEKVLKPGDFEGEGDAKYGKLCVKEEENENHWKKSSDLSSDKDLENLLLYYMKRTFKSRKKNSDEKCQILEADLKNDLSTDYDTEEDLNIKKSPSETPTFRCDYCSKLLRGIHSLKNHCMRKHGNHSEKNVLCDKCPTRFYTDFEFHRHYQTHYSEKKYLCHLCSKTFFQKSSLELHLRYHKNDRRYQCDTCRKKFFTNNHLKRHCLTHTNQKDFKCEPCDRSFRYKDHLRRHMRTVHFGVRSHYCRECDKSFVYLSQLKFHERSHKGLLVCEHCKKSFKTGFSLKVHQRQCLK